MANSMFVTLALHFVCSTCQKCPKTPWLCKLHKHKPRENNSRRWLTHTIPETVEMETTLCFTNSLYTPPHTSISCWWWRWWWVFSIWHGKSWLNSGIKTRKRANQICNTWMKHMCDWLKVNFLCFRLFLPLSLTCPVLRLLLRSPQCHSLRYTLVLMWNDKWIVSNSLLYSCLYAIINITINFNACSEMYGESAGFLCSLPAFSIRLTNFNSNR